MNMIAAGYCAAYVSFIRRSISYSDRYDRERVVGWVSLRVVELWLVMGPLRSQGRHRPDEAVCTPVARLPSSLSEPEARLSGPGTGTLRVSRQTTRIEMFT